MKNLAEKQHQGNLASSSLFPRVQKIRNLIGEQSLLLALPKGKKKPTINWSRLSHDRMKDAPYLEKLEAGNIAVILGKKSDDLCSIDFDSDDWLELFLKVNERNPAIVKTLRTRGKRGGNVWIRCRGAYPLKTQFLKVLGESIGEWRANGNYTVISGTHPEGGEYGFTFEAQVPEIDFASIKWPEGVKPPKMEDIEEQELPIHTQLNTEAQIPRSADTQLPRGSDTQEIQEIQVVEEECIFDPSPFFAKVRGTSNGLLWKMAGRLLRWEKENGREATSAEKHRLFMEWYSNSRNYIDPADDEESYMMKWLNACVTRRQADDETALTYALEKAQKEPLPAVAAAKYSIPLKPKAQKLVAILYHLSGGGKSGFFLSCRDAGKLLDLSPIAANTYLNQLSLPKGAWPILEIVNVGSRASGLATEYKFTKAALDISASAS
jgi:hypothetical protein